MEKTVRRHVSFLPRWCQAFGEHQPDPAGEGRMVEWLIGENCVGLLIAPELRHKLLHQLLGPERPELEFQRGLVRLNRHDYSDAAVLGQNGYAALHELLLDRGDTHIFLTYHLIYPPGTRIITASRKAPLPLLYKEISPLLITVGE
jgi:hypothetical protein